MSSNGAKRDPPRLALHHTGGLKAPARCGEGRLRRLVEPAKAGLARA